MTVGGGVSALGAVWRGEPLPNLNPEIHPSIGARAAPTPPDAGDHPSTTQRRRDGRSSPHAGRAGTPQPQPPPDGTGQRPGGQATKPRAGGPGGTPADGRDTPGRPDDGPAGDHDTADGSNPGNGGPGHGGTGSGAAGNAGSGPDRGDSPAGSARSAGSGGGGPQAEVVRLTNAARADAGCEPVEVDARLRSAARKHSADMAERGYFSHTDPDGTSPRDRATAAGYDNPTGENIARGYRTARSVFEAWMDSDGHRRNILDCESTEVGIGLHRGGEDGPYWTQMFGAG